MKLDMMGLGLVQIAEGLARILTLGRYWAHWEVDYIFWNSRRHYVKRNNP